MFTHKRHSGGLGRELRKGCMGCAESLQPSDEVAFQHLG